MHYLLRTMCNTQSRPSKIALTSFEGPPYYNQSPVFLNDWPAEGPSMYYWLPKTHNLLPTTVNKTYTHYKCVRQLEMLVALKCIQI